MASATTISQADLLDLVKKLLGADACSYLKNKHRGGSSGRKGTRYEDFYIAYQVAKLACANLDNFGTWPEVGGQVLAFVDDLTVAEVAATRYFQLKNVASLAWESGEHPIAADFRLQHALSNELNEPSPSNVLVVADLDMKATLEAKIPADIQAYSSVEYFPYAATPNRLVFECPELRDVLRPLARTANPSFADLEGVFGVLIIGCMRHEGKVTVDELLRSTKACIPNMLAPLDVANVKQHVTQDFVNTLAAIPRLAYAFDKGFFSWTAFGTSGVFGVDCSSEEFKQFQDTVVRHQPKTFDDFEGLLP